MNTHTRGFMFAVAVCALAVVVVAGCTSTTGGGTNTGGGMRGGATPGGTTGGGMMGGGSGSGTYASDGERIFLTGVGVDGRDISRTAPAVSQGSLMMGGGGCGSCHAASGRGGTITMMTGTAIKAPDITYDALITVGFTDASIRTAITDGLDEAAKPLDVAMPRWKMSSADLDATLAYLKVLSAK
jgi:mono/diheme cytochrome c family protein